MAKNTDSQIRQEIYSYFKQSQNIIFATCDKGQPKVRPMVLFYVDFKFWLVTYRNDAKVFQIEKNSKMEICYLLQEDGQNGYIRATGDVKIINDLDLKSRATEFCYFFDTMFEGASDPDFCLMELDFSSLEFMRPGETYTQSINM